MRRLIHHIFAFTVCLGAVMPATGSILGIKDENKSSIGIYIYDLTGDSILVNDSAEQVMTPASVTKTFTTASAMTLLGKDFRFSTTVSLDGQAPNKGVANANLVVTSAGDPTLESDNFSQNLGFCDSIISNLRRLNIKEINGKIIVRQNMADSGQPEEWMIEDVAWAYGAGIYGLNWRDNIFSLKTASGETTPHIPDLIIKKHKTRRSNQKRGFDSNVLNLYGPRLNRSRTTVVSTMPSPHKVFEYELAKTLRDSGFILNDRQIAKGKVMTPVYTHRSPALYDILKSLMVRSDNMFAEGILRAFAPDSSRYVCIDMEKQLWKDRGLDTESINIYDGSGLGRANGLSAMFIGKMLQWMAASEYAADYIDMFPIAGETGTMRNFMKGTRLQGRLVMKTGSMGGVQTYAGYLLDDNKKPTHVVVIFTNRFFCSRGQLKESIYNFLSDTFITPSETNPTESIN